MTSSKVGKIGGLCNDTCCTMQGIGDESQEKESNMDLWLTKNEQDLSYFWIKVFHDNT